MRNEAHAPATRAVYFARSSKTGTPMLCRTRLAVDPKNTSARNRWPCVLMATRSHPFFSTHLMICSAGSPYASSASVRDPGRLKFLAHLFQIGRVFGNLGTDRVRSVRSSRPSVGHVQQDHAAVRQLGQLLDVLDDRPVCRSPVQRHENGFVHRFPSAAADHLPRRFQRIRQTIDVHGGDQDSTDPSRRSAETSRSSTLPCACAELVKCSSGNMANGSCSASTT